MEALKTPVNYRQQEVDLFTQMLRQAIYDNAYYDESASAWKFWLHDLSESLLKSLVAAWVDGFGFYVESGGYRVEEMLLDALRVNTPDAHRNLTNAITEDISYSMEEDERYKTIRDEAIAYWAQYNFK